MKKIINLFVIAGITIHVLVAGNIPLPEVPITWYNLVTSATNKNEFIKGNLPTYISQYPVWAKTLTRISVTNDFANKNQYIEIYNNTYTNAKKDPFFLISSTNVTQTPRSITVAPLRIHSYGGADPFRP